jgi:hypothetical protein
MDDQAAVTVTFNTTNEAAGKIVTAMIEQGLIHDQKEVVRAIKAVKAALNK